MAKQLPKPFKTDYRICFALAFFETEEDAETFGRHQKESGSTYNGGFYHGSPCGRDATWDHTDPDSGKFLYASTF